MIKLELVVFEILFGGAMNLRYIGRTWELKLTLINSYKVGHNTIHNKEIVLAHTRQDQPSYKEEIVLIGNGMAVVGCTISNLDGEDLSTYAIGGVRDIYAKTDGVVKAICFKDHADLYITQLPWLSARRTQEALTRQYKNDWSATNNNENWLGWFVGIVVGLGLFAWSQGYIQFNSSPTNSNPTQQRLDQ